LSAATPTLAGLSGNLEPDKQAIRIGNQTMYLEPNTAVHVQQHMADVEDGKVAIQVQRIVQVNN